ncbi:MAG: dockerin type I domain-containing protein [Synechococcales cyanobacterium]
MSRWLCCVTLAGAGWGLFVSLAVAQSLGDLNGDGRVDATDATILGDYLQGRGFLSDGQITAADLDQDGRVTQADLDWLLRTTGARPAMPNADIQLDSGRTGRVVDRASGQPLANVEVAIPGAGISVRSDDQGRFQLPASIPQDQILVAKLDNYLPYSQTTDGELSLNVMLDRWDQTKTLVLQSDVVHLGDDRYSPDSAGADQFRLRTQGTELVRSFTVTRPPTRDPLLRIGSLIGLDTAAAVRAGQSRIRGADMSPMRVFLNGTPVGSIELGGNNLSVSLPRSLVQMGQNTVTLRTGEVRDYLSSRQSQIAVPFFGGIVQFGIPIQQGPGSLVVDHDDVELANVVIELP